MISRVRITVEDIFQTAADLRAEERAVYLDRVCGEDAALRREVEELLAFHDSDGGFLETPALQDAARDLARDLARSKTAPAADDDTLREADWTLGPYRILHQLGKGGMGVVYLAVDTRNERQVAIKVLLSDTEEDEERLARFTREGRMLRELKSLRHPNIAEIYEQAEYDGRPCLVLEYVPGETLADRLREGRFSVEETARYGLQIADALRSAHEQRILHRDLKPANIKITPEGRIKILDFGLAKHFHPEGADGTDAPETRSLSLTESGVLLGTPAYMSPEQWNGQPVDHRTDLWAFGCLLYEMLTGAPPFLGKTRAETMKAVFAANPDWSALPNATPLALQDLMLRCFRPAPQRLPDAGEAVRTLSRSASEHEFAPWLALRTWFGKIDRRRKLAAAVAMLVLAALLGLKYTPMGGWIRPAGAKLEITDNSDLATLLPKYLKPLTPELVRAALLSKRSSSEDLLQNEQWRELMKSRESKAAVDDLIQALGTRIQQAGESAQLYAILAQAYVFRFYLTSDARDKDLALQAVRNARRFGADNVEVMIAEGNVLLSFEQTEAAIEVLEAARRKFSDHPDILAGLAYAHDLKGDDDANTEALYRQLLDARVRAEGKPYWGDFEDQGWFYYYRGNYEQAILSWREVIKNNRLIPNGYLNLGNAYYSLGCFAEAVRAHQDSITNGGDSVEARTSLGADLFFLGKYEESIQQLRVPTSRPNAATDPAMITAWGNLGDSYAQNGQPVDAKLAYETALTLVEKQLLDLPKNEVAIALKAEFLAKLSRLDPATRREDPVLLLKNIERATPPCQECLATAVVAYAFAGKDADAARTAKAVAAMGYSPFLLVLNPQLAGLQGRPEFKQLQQLLRERRKSC